MLDPKFVRQNSETVRAALKNRNNKFDFDAFFVLDAKRLELLKGMEDIAAAQNNIDKEIKVLLKDKHDPKPKIAESKELKIKLDVIRAQFNELDKEWEDKLLRIPNIPHESLPVGSPENNKTIRVWEYKRNFDFKPLDHIALAEKLDIIDFKRGTKISGSNFILFKGMGAQLERALINFMLDLHTNEHGYTEVWPPKVVNADSMRGTGQLPNLKDDMYAVPQDNGQELYLIPTAEVPVTNILRDDIVDEDKLPVCYTAYTPCFRKEAGSYGKDTKGLMRVHEFDKVELVKFVKPENSYDELEKLLLNACRILEELKIMYRVVLLAKCYDIEIYCHGIDKWLEVSSCSNFEDFQARRANIRYREKDGGKLKFVHTLNGSGVALARLVVAILENYQEADGRIKLPEPLRRYLNGREYIG
jgi:seryl-tRNA synthetase